MHLQNIYAIEGHPIRSFEHQGITWFCINDFLAIVRPEQETPSNLHTIMAFMCREIPADDPDIREWQRLLNAKLSH